MSRGVGMRIGFVIVYGIVRVVVNMAIITKVEDVDVVVVGSINKKVVDVRNLLLMTPAVKDEMYNYNTIVVTLLLIFELYRRNVWVQCCYFDLRN